MDIKNLPEEEYLQNLKVMHGITEQKPKVKIPVEHPGLLEVPEGKNVEDLPLSHFKALIKKKGWEKISKGLTNLHTWNKDKNPKLASWADKTQEKLAKWIESQREKE
ncbi:MAG: hypothetical protein PVG65_04425 [Candidatus Thorarchaeota archaeon]|jgi:hypothetical protein